MGEHLQGELEEFLHKGPEDLAVGEAVQDLHHHIPKLVLRVLRKLGYRQIGQDHREGTEIALEEVEVLRGVRDLQAIPHLHHHLQPNLHRELRLDEALSVLLIVEDRSHPGSVGTEP